MVNGSLGLISFGWVTFVGNSLVPDALAFDLVTKVSKLDLWVRFLWSYLRRSDLVTATPSHSNPIAKILGFTKVGRALQKSQGNLRACGLLAAHICRGVPSAAQ